jgi:hypothetical protein
MADYAASVLAKGQAIVTDQYQAPEQRRQTPTLLSLALQNQEISIPNAQELRVSPLRTVDVNFLADVTAGSAVAKTIAHTGNHGVSAAINVTYVQHVETFSLPRKLATNNIIKYQQMYNNLLLMAWKNLRTRHDNSALAYLVANRCQLTNAVMTPLIASAAPGTWSDANKALEIDQVNKALFMEYAKSLMQARFYTGEYDVVADLQLSRLFNYQSRQGSGNFADLGYQFEGQSFVTTQQSISSAYTQGAALIMPKNSFAGLNWNEDLNKRGEDAGIGPIGLLTTAIDPLGSGAEADVSMYSARNDSSAVGGSTQDIIDQWEFTLTIGYVVPPLTLSNDSVVHMVGQVA